MVNEEPKDLKFHDIMLDVLNREKNVCGILDSGSRFGQAYNISYTDIYDFASAGNKQSLKKWRRKVYRTKR